MSDPITNNDRFYELAGAICDGRASEQDRSELNALVDADPTFRADYFEYCWLHSALRLQLHALQSTQRARQLIDHELANFTEKEPEEAPRDCFPAIPLPPPPTLQGTLGHFSTGWPMAYLIATAMMAFGLLVCAHTYISQPSPAPNRQLVGAKEHIISAKTPDTLTIGRITGMVECVWAKAEGRSQGAGTSGRNPVHHLQPTIHTPVSLGDRLALRSGLLEITYDTGARVILQGPVTYDVESRDGGYLAVGKLTAKVEKKSGRNKTEEATDTHSSFLIPSSPAPLFTIRTPTAFVTDLGTEFGVEVGAKGQTTSHVFRGSVEVRTIPANRTAKAEFRVLHASEFATVETHVSPNGMDRRIVATTIAKPTDFVRKLTNHATGKPEPYELVAFWRFDGNDFLTDSSGHGHMLVNHGASQVDDAATFDGTAMMNTVDSICLIHYQKVRISWSQKLAASNTKQIVWEHTRNYNEIPGAIIAYTENSHGETSICGVPGNSYNVDEFPVRTNVWEHFMVQFDRTAYRAYIVRVFKDGIQIGNDTHDECFVPESFVNAVWNIGGRADKNEPRYFNGQIDDMKIEGLRPLSQPSAAPDKGH
jgi:hypothetical protein